jgi:hypothetical protein
MAKLTPAQDKAIQAFSADGDFPKGTREVTIKALESAGLIEQWNGDGSWDLTNDGRKYLGIKIGVDVPATSPTATVDDMLAELNTNPWDFVPVLPNGWDLSKRNRDAWKGLSQEEITADIATARTVANRRDRRSGNTLPFKFAKS